MDSRSREKERVSFSTVSYARSPHIASFNYSQQTAQQSRLSVSFWAGELDSGRRNELPCLSGWWCRVVCRHDYSLKSQGCRVCPRFTFHFMSVFCSFIHFFHLLAQGGEWQSQREPSFHLQTRWETLEKKEMRWSIFSDVGGTGRLRGWGWTGVWFRSPLWECHHPLYLKPNPQRLDNNCFPACSLARAPLLLPLPSPAQPSPGPGHSSLMSPIWSTWSSVRGKVFGRAWVGGISTGVQGMSAPISRWLSGQWAIAVQPLEGSGII